MQASAVKQFFKCQKNSIQSRIFLQTECNKLSIFSVTPLQIVFLSSDTDEAFICTFILCYLAPDLRPLLVLQGEGHRSLLFALIEKAVEFYSKEGILSNHRLTQIQITKSFNASKLSYPGKIATHENSVTFSDSGNHRIILIQKFGSAEEKIVSD